MSSMSEHQFQLSKFPLKVIWITYLPGILVALFQHFWQFQFQKHTYKLLPKKIGFPPVGPGCDGGEQVLGMFIGNCPTVQLQDFKMAKDLFNRQSIIKMIIINTRPRPTFGRLGLEWIVERLQFWWVNFSRLASHLRRSARREKMTI